MLYGSSAFLGLLLSLALTGNGHSSLKEVPVHADAAEEHSSSSLSSSMTIPSSTHGVKKGAKRKPSAGSTPIVPQHAAANDDAEIQDPYTYSGSKAISMDLSEQTLSLHESGVTLATYRISSGKAYTPTPTGTFRIHRKQTLRISSQAVPYRMPYYLAFTPNEAYGIHALPYLGASPESSDYWHEALDHIGTPVSHGCVRLLPDVAVDVYAWAEIGMPVTIRR